MRRLTQAVFMHHDDKGHTALKHNASRKGLTGQATKAVTITEPVYSVPHAYICLVATPGSSSYNSIMAREIVFGDKYLTSEANIDKGPRVLGCCIGYFTS